MQTTLTVTELTASIKQLLEGTYPEVRLQGEISNFKLHTSGHCYFVLKDAGAQIQAVMFRAKAALLKKLPKEGDLVLVQGTIGVYEQRGQYQIIISSMEPQGLGALLAKLEELKKFYASKGYFESSRKKPLPPFPKRIGVITSPTGAVIRDILTILKRRGGRFELILNPVKVQGEGSFQEIAEAIDQMNRYNLADVLIVARGGGSIEDLWAFNEALVVEAIYRSEIPIISAVGHETDVTLSDFVADVRAPTPSAAAEIVIKERAGLFEKLRTTISRSESFITNCLKMRRLSLNALLKHPYLMSSEQLLSKRLMQMDEMQLELDQHLKNQLTKEKLKIARLSHQLQILDPKTQVKALQKNLLRLSLFLNSQMQQNLSKRREKLENCKGQLLAQNPKGILSRGYALLFSEKSQSLIISSKELQRGDPIRAELADGTAHMTVQ